jgi:hypothetical protein
MEELLKIIGQFLGLVEPDSNKKRPNAAEDAAARAAGLPLSNGSWYPNNTFRARRRMGRL